MLPLRLLPTGSQTGGTTVALHLYEACRFKDYLISVESPCSLTRSLPRPNQECARRRSLAFASETRSHTAGDWFTVVRRCGCS
jgi:hypothetical protein